MYTVREHDRMLLSVCCEQMLFCVFHRGGQIQPECLRKRTAGFCKHRSMVASIIFLTKWRDFCG